MIKYGHDNSAFARQGKFNQGFSLIEILIVLMILGILTALIFNALGPSLTNAKIAATRTTIKQIDDIIQARYETIRKADVSVEAKKVAALTSGLTEKDAEYLIRKILYRQALPQRPEDMFGLDLDSSTASDNAPYAANWTGDTITEDDTDDPDDNNQEVLSSEVLLFALTQGSSVRALPGGKTYPVPILELDNINNNHIQDTDGNGIPELVDEWGLALRFYNFPTRLIRPSGGSNPINLTNARTLIPGLVADGTDNGPNGQDPLDTTGILFGRLNNKYSSAGTLTHTPPNSTTSVEVFDASNYHDANTYYFPLLVSAGPDGSTMREDGFGLGSPTSTLEGNRLCEVTDASAMTDNITNRQ